MNLFLHGIGPDGTDEHRPPIEGGTDALRDEPSMRANVVITNPPFGKKSSITIVNEEGDTDRHSLTCNRPDFWTTTSNKQLNFVQHVKSLLAIHGRAAVVVPDNVLFARRGRNRSSEPPEGVRRSHASSPAHRYLLRTRSEGERSVLRPEARRGGTVDEDRLGLRPSHEQTFHVEDKANDPG